MQVGPEGRDAVDLEPAAGGGLELPQIDEGLLARAAADQRFVDAVAVGVENGDGEVLDIGVAENLINVFAGLSIKHPDLACDLRSGAGDDLGRTTPFDIADGDVDAVQVAQAFVGI